ncbi:MAG: hypothetical protein IAI50_16095 [Candidatus Eremiobacteraeota bacterium]|nr:hypothetical protein [Candidatus Eremiobacteraeota bacterium]
MSGYLRSVPAVRSAEISPLASLYLVHDLSPYPALNALATPNPDIRVDLRAAEFEAASLVHSSVDPDIVRRLVGIHSLRTIKTYANHLNRYGRFAGERGQPTAPLTAATLCQYLWSRMEQGVNYPQLVRENDALSACMTMLNIESCTSDPLVKRTKKAIGRKIGTRHDGRAKPLMVRDLRRALPWLEKVEKTEPDRAFMYRLVLVLGTATMLRREEFASVRIRDLKRTSYGYSLAVYKTKTRKATEPPAYIHLERTHDERICPVRLIDDYFRRYGFTDGPFLRRLLADGKPGRSAMHPHKISTIVGDVVVGAGIGSRKGFTGHSLRNGGINSAAQAGKTLDEIRSVSLQRDRESTYRYINDSVCVRPMTTAIFT